MELLADVSPETVQAVLTDHPYGSTDCHWDKVVDLAAWWKEIDRVTPPNAIVASFAAQPFATDLINSNRKNFRYELVWHKAKAVGFLNANRQPLRGHELIMVFCRQPGKSVYNPQKTPGKPYRITAKSKTTIYRHHKFLPTVNHGDRHPTSVLALNALGGKRYHPTQKPLLMCEWLVKSYTNAGHLVLDPFAGSATFAVACHRTGRRFLGFERDPEIFKAAVARLKAELQ